MFLKKCFKLYYWPPLTFGWFLSSFIITYIISVLDGHVYVFFPNISDTGATPPESCIFSQFLNIGAMLYGVTMYIRYSQINSFLETYEVSLVKKLNAVGLWCAVCICIGVTIVGNFQETEIFLIHALGAGMAFGIGTLYLFIQTWISFSFRHIYYKYPAYKIGPKMLHFRAFLTVSCAVLLSGATVCYLIALSQFKGKKISWWTEEDGAFQLRLAASFSEWIIAIFFGIFILSLTNEYKLMEYEEVRFTNKCENFTNNKESSKV